MSQRVRDKAADPRVWTSLLCAGAVCGLISGATARDDSGVKQFFLEQANRVIGGGAPRPGPLRESSAWSPASGRSAQHFAAEAPRRIARRPVPLRRVAGADAAGRRPLTIHPHAVAALAGADEPSGGGVTSMYTDPTLRAGDAVMTARGLRVFQGSEGFPYRAEDFTTVVVAEGLDNGLRRALIEADQSPVGQTIGRLAHL